MKAQGERGLVEAKALAAQFFSGRQTRAGVVARRLLGTPDSRDAILADHLVRESRQRTRMDGSTDGSLVKSAWSLLELIQLDCPPDYSGVVRVVGWLLARQNQPGRFGEGCSDERHSRGTCNHFLSGFFSPATADESIAPVGFPNGIVIREEAPARFAASCFTLRAVLRARQERRPGVLNHVGSLLNLGEVWGGWGGPWPADVVLFALAALAHAPLESRDRVEQLAAQVARRQRADGGWDAADLIHALDALLSIPGDTTQGAVQAALPRLTALAEAGELFTESANEERSLIALRALVSVR